MSMSLRVSSLVLAGSLAVWASTVCGQAPTAPPSATPPATAAATAARPARPGTVTAHVLNIRARPGQQYEVIGKFKKDDPVQVVGEAEGWYEVLVPPTVEAWIAMRFIDAANKITADRVKVHSGPGAIFSIYGFVKKGDIVKKLGEPTADGWQKFEALPGLSAWVSREFVAVKVPGDTSGSVVKPADEKAAGTAAAARPPPAPDVPAKAATGGGDQTEAATAAGAEEAVVTPPPPAQVPEKAAPVVTAVKPVPAVTPAAPATATAPKPVVAPTVPVKTGPTLSDTLAGGRPATDAATTVNTTRKGEPLAVPASGKGVKTGTTTVTRDGVLTSLKEQASAAATHLLSKHVGNTLYPECYIILGKDTNAKLQDWENRNVRVFGRELWYPNWKRPVLEVSGIEPLAQ